MRPLICILLIALLAGCETKKEARLQAHEAFMEGQMQAQQQMKKDLPPQVVIEGPVNNHVVAWQDGLTVAKAIVTADYTGFMNPVLVRVVRNGQIVAELRGIDLLHHQDEALQPGDIVDIVP